jgi:hypothetical protein
MPVGDALDPDTMIGPMSSSRHRDAYQQLQSIYLGASTDA